MSLSKPQFENEELISNKRTFENAYMESGGGSSSSGVSNKRVRYSNSNAASPKKRLSNESTNSVDSITKKISKTVTGQLVTKNMYCVNNEPFYLFKFLVDNVAKNYYGNSNMFKTLKIDFVYEIELVYENKRLAIANATLCKDIEKVVVVKQFVDPSDFDSEDTITVGAKLMCGFKLLDNDLFKAVFIVNYGETLDNSRLAQIECMANLKRWAASIKDETISDENSLLAYFHNRQDVMVTLYRIKCNQSNGNFKNFALQNITQISTSDDDFYIQEDDESATSISRLNKRIYYNEITKVNVERQSEDRFSISYQMKETDDEWHRGSFFIKQNNNGGGNDKKNDAKVEKLEKLETDLNQLNDLIENDILRVYICVSVDMTSNNCNNNCNVLGFTKIEIDSDVFEGV